MTSLTSVIEQLSARTITFTVYGEARPAGSKRAFLLRRRDGSTVTRANGTPIINVTDANAKSKDWKQQVAHAAREVYQGELLTGPLKVTLRFYRPRPLSHYGAMGLNKKGRESIAPTGRPDCLKLARAVEDALSKVVWQDDAQIVVELIVKNWGQPARCEITVEAIDSSANVDSGVV